MSQNEREMVAHRLHWSSLLFDIASHVWSYLIPIGLAVLGAARGDLFWTLLAAFFFSISLLRSVFRFFTLTYSIVDRKLVVRQGLLIRNIRTVPLKRIQNIDLVQNLFHRLLNVAEVKVETAAGSEPEATLRVLAMAQVERLRSEIFGQQVSTGVSSLPGSVDSETSSLIIAEMEGSSASSSSSATQIPEGKEGTAGHWNPEGQIDDRLESEVELKVGKETGNTPQDRSQGRGGQLSRENMPLLAIPNRWLVFAGLASNRGMILVGVLMGVAYQIADQAKFLEKLDVRLMRQWLPRDWDQGSWLLVVGVGLVLAFIGVKILGVIWYLLRFSGYRLTRRGEDLRISCGLLTRVSATVPRSRIQFICIRQDWVSRWFGFCSLQIETAGGGKRESAQESVSGRWFIPVMPVAGLPEILSEIRDQLDWSPQNWEWQSMSRQAFWRMLRKGVLLALLIGLIVGYSWRPWGGLAGLAALPLIVVWLRAKWKVVRYARFDVGVAHQDGVLTRRTNVTFFEKIQGISLTTSPFDRRWKMTTLSIDTAGAGAAESLLMLPMFDQEFAKMERDQLQKLTAQHPAVFR